MRPDEPIVSTQQALCFAEIVAFEDAHLETRHSQLTASTVTKARDLLQQGLAYAMPPMVLERLTAAIARAEHDGALAAPAQRRGG